jgi:hypothetical protein
VFLTFKYDLFAQLKWRGESRLSTSFLILGHIFIVTYPKRGLSNFAQILSDY